jgi:hypothetical protein
MSALDECKTLLSECLSVQELLEAEDETEALEDIFLFGVKAKDTQRPFITVSQMSRVKTRAGTENFFCSGSIEIVIQIDEADLEGTTYEDFYGEVWAIGASIQDDMTELAGTGSFMDLERLEITGVQQSAWNDAKSFWSIKMSLDYP